MRKPEYEHEITWFDLLVVSKLQTSYLTQSELKGFSINLALSKALKYLGLFANTVENNISDFISR